MAHRAERVGDTLEGVGIACSRPVPEQEQQVVRRRELGGRAEAAERGVEALGELLRGAVEHAHVERGVGGLGLEGGADLRGDLSGGVARALRGLLPERPHARHPVQESEALPARVLRDVGRGEERLALGRE
ncbi:MAG: hypothetical protein AAGN64_04495 [Bacteroidota bacterium]